LENCQVHGSRCWFSKILIFAWMLKFYHWQTELSIVFLEVTDYFVRFCNACQILKSAGP
jgi:Ni,Fe-hydrogenase I cytochrome b subunit